MDHCEHQHGSKAFYGEAVWSAIALRLDVPVTGIMSRLACAESELVSAIRYSETVGRSDRIERTFGTRAVAGKTTFRFGRQTGPS